MWRDSICLIFVVVSGLIVGVGPTLAQSTSVEFVVLDTETQGNWKDVYGQDGYNIILDTEAYPSYAEVSFTGADTWTWVASTDDVRGLETAAGGDRLATCWFSGSPWTIDINLTDGRKHQVAVYFLDWDSTVRATTVEVLDAATSEVLDSQEMVDYNAGKYLVWEIKGHVVINVIYVAGANSVISGLFFDTVTSPGASTDPHPVDATSDVPRDVVLSWAPGEFAVTHDVYLGTVFEGVNDASRADDRGVLLSQGQTATTYDLAGVYEYGQTYYWRIDEVNGAPDNTIFKGETWSFTVEPLAYPIANVTATSIIDSLPGADPENLVNGSGLNENDEHSVESFDMWQIAPVGDDPPYVEFTFDAVYKLHQMLVWNYNVQFELMLGFGLKDVTIEYSENGADWAVLGDVVFNQATAQPTDRANTIVDFGGVAAQYVRITINSGWGTLPVPQYGLSEVRFLHIPVQAREPQPEDGAVDVAVDSDLVWRVGREAVSHEVYLSTDPNALELIEMTGAATADPGILDLATTYYWRVDEVNEAEAISAWAGAVWSFTTPEYIVVDDFEAYNDDEGTRVFDAWLDGWDIDDNGSQVGYGDAPFAETTIVNSGNQSMPLAYDNVAGLSEATLSLDGEDWTAGGIKSLSVAVYGASGNTGQLYVKINGVKMSGTAGIQRSLWLQLEVDLSSASAALLQNVTSLTLGVEDAGAAGMLYVDDVRLGTVVPVVPLDTTPIAVENASFELPGGEGRYLFNDAAVPGWSVDEPVADSGVQLDWSNTDGGWGAFLMNGDPAIWQFTDHTIAAGEVYQLKVDAASAATTLRMTLYYDVNGARMPAATRDVAMDGKLQEYALIFTADDVPDAIGKKLGIEFSNISTTETWAGLDYVTLGIAN